MSFICPDCRREFGTEGGLNHHRVLAEKRGSHLTKQRYMPRESRFSAVEIEAFNHQSDMNTLIFCQGDVKVLTPGQVRQLRRRGLIDTELGRGGFKILTEKGRELLEEIENEVS